MTKGAFTVRYRSSRIRLAAATRLVTGGQSASARQSNVKQFRFTAANRLWPIFDQDSTSGGVYYEDQMKPFLTVVIPARDEEETVQSVVRAVREHPAVAGVIVVDNGSSDATARAAADVGAHVVSEPVRGLGRAMKCGVAAADTDHILRTDADISNWNTSWVDLLCQRKEGCLMRAVFTSPYDDFPVTRLVVRPFLEAFLPDLAALPTPISGTYSFCRNDIEWEHLPDDWSFDIALVIQAYERGISIADVDIGVLADRQRDMSHYEPMAREIHRYFISKYTRPRSEVRA